MLPTTSFPRTSNSTLRKHHPLKVGLSGAPSTLLVHWDTIPKTCLITCRLPKSGNANSKTLLGKVAVITGGSEGVGYGCSHTFLSKGISKLFILSLSEEVVDSAIDAIKQEMGEEAAKKVVWLQCDLTDWHAVKETADKIASSTDRLDILVNNAGRGIMTYELTKYGVDRHVSICGPPTTDRSRYDRWH